jgi:hypothetical protein
MQVPANALPPAQAEVRVATTAELRRALDEALPGARILVEPGTYEGFHVSDVAGGAADPILVEPADPARRPVFRGTVHLSDVAHLALSGLEIAGAPGNGLNVDDGGTFETPSQHLALRDLWVQDCGGRGNDDGIKLSGVDDFVVEGCTIERWGRGGSALDAVGCRRGRIEACTVRDREQDAAASGVQLKGGSREIEVLRCRFEHAGQRAVNLGGSTGLAYFRPWPEGFEAKDVRVEGCTFVGSLAPVAFVGCDGASVRWNTFYRPRKWLARVLQETREPGFAPCRGGVVADNLIAYRSDELAVAVNVGPATAVETFEFARNYWHCIDDPGRPRPDLPTAEVDPAGGADPQFVDAEDGDLRLGAGSPARRHGADAAPRAR